MSQVAKLPDMLHQAFQSGEVMTASGEKASLRSNVSLEEAAMLYEAVRSARPRTSAEVGFAQGISTLAILQALKDNESGQHHVMDPFQATYGYAGPTMVKKAGLNERMVFHEKFAEEVIPGLGPLQFAFIDASHLFDLTISEFVLIDKRLEIGGLIGFHDTWMVSVQKVIRYLVSNRGYRIRREFGGVLHETSRRRWPEVRARLLRLLPAHSRIFRYDLLNPWSALGLGNLVILEKAVPDERDWRFHQEF